MPQIPLAPRLRRLCLRPNIRKRRRRSQTISAHALYPQIVPRFLGVGSQKMERAWLSPFLLCSRFWCQVWQGAVPCALTQPS
eukprot:1482061-Pleurochrysis_carterae.AAC.3